MEIILINSFFNNKRFVKPARSTFSNNATASRNNVTQIYWADSMEVPIPELHSCDIAVE